MKKLFLIGVAAMSLAGCSSDKAKSNKALDDMTVTGRPYNEKFNPRNQFKEGRDFGPEGK
jgi:hypothetical protein